MNRAVGWDCESARGSRTVGGSRSVYDNLHADAARSVENAGALSGRRSGRRTGSAASEDPRAVARARRPIWSRPSLVAREEPVERNSVPRREVGKATGAPGQALFVRVRTGAASKKTGAERSKPSAEGRKRERRRRDVPQPRESVVGALREDGLGAHDAGDRRARTSIPVSSGANTRSDSAALRPLTAGAGGRMKIDMRSAFSPQQAHRSDRWKDRSRVLGMTFI